jgi:hypothetical protein
MLSGAAATQRFQLIPRCQPQVFERRLQNRELLESLWCRPYPVAKSAKKGWAP